MANCAASETPKAPQPLHRYAAQAALGARRSRPRARAARGGGRGRRAVRGLERAPSSALLPVRPDQPRRLHRRPGPMRRQDRPPDDEPLRRPRVLVRPQLDLLAHVPAGHRGVPPDDRGAVLRRHAIRQLRGHAVRALLLRRLRLVGGGTDRASPAGVAGRLRRGEVACRLGNGRPPARDQRARAARPAARALRSRPPCP